MWWLKLAYYGVAAGVAFYLGWASDLTVLDEWCRTVVLTGAGVLCLLVPFQKTKDAA